MAIAAIIFDIDGVLADSRKAVAHNTKCLMREFGFSVLDRRVDEMSTAHSAESVLLALAPPLSSDPLLLKRMLSRLAELTRENIGMVKPTYLGGRIPEFAKKYRLAAASNRKSSAKMVLRELGIEGYFEVVMTSADALPKPDPEMIRMALLKLAVAPSEALFVGDNDEDRQAAEGAGVAFERLMGETEGECRKFCSRYL